MLVWLHSAMLSIPRLKILSRPSSAPDRIEQGEHIVFEDGTSSLFLSEKFGSGTLLETKKLNIRADLQVEDQVDYSE